MKVDEQSWTMLIDPQFKGKISFLDAPDNVAAIAGLLTGAENPMDMNDDQMGRAEEVLRKLHQPTSAFTGATRRNSSRRWHRVK